MLWTGAETERMCKAGRTGRERKNELAFFTHVGGRKVGLLNTVQLQSNEKKCV